MRDRGRLRPGRYVLSPNRPVPAQNKRIPIRGGQFTICDQPDEKIEGQY